MIRKILKSSLFAMTAVGVVFGAATASAQSFTVSIREIQLLSNPDNVVTTTGTVVYKPESRVGENATRTIDLFNSSQRAGTRLTIADPANNTVYSGMAIRFDIIRVSSGTTQYYDLMPQMRAAGLLSAQNWMLIGPNGTNATPANTANMALGVSSSAPMQPILAQGFVNLPSLQFKLATSDLVVNGTTGVSLSVSNLPVVVPGSSGTDSADITDLVVGVNLGALHGVNTPPYDFAAGGASWNVSNVSLGLFAESIPENPIAVRTFTAVSPTNPWNISQTYTRVTFTDAPMGNRVVPILWLDADADGRLDVGERVAISNTTISLSVITVATGGGTSSLSNFVGISRSAVAMGPRAITLTVGLPGYETGMSAVTLTNIAASASLVLSWTTLGVASLEPAAYVSKSAETGAPHFPAALTGSLTVVYSLNKLGNSTRSLTLPIVYGGMAAGAHITQTAAAGAFLPALVSPTTNLVGVTGVSYVSQTQSLRFTNIPLFLTHMGATAGVTSGTYSVSFTMGISGTSVFTAPANSRFWVTATTVNLTNATGESRFATGTDLEDPSSNLVTLTGQTGIDNGGGASTSDGLYRLGFDITGGVR